MAITVAFVNLLRAYGPASHAAAALLALAVASFIGSSIAMLLLQPPGFYPPLSSIAGDSFRWVIFGAIVFFAREHLQRETRATAALEAASIERTSLDKQMIEAQLEVLQGQREPHFLFNTIAER